MKRRNRDWGLAVYFLYGVLVLNAASFSDFLSYQALQVVLMLVLPSLMALREMMVGFEIPGKVEPEVLIPAAPFILGAVYDVLFFAGIVLTLLSGFKSQHLVTAKNLLVPVGFLTVVIAIIRGGPISSPHPRDPDRDDGCGGDIRHPARTGREGGGRVQGRVD
ncbi:hypothetical protein [Thermococcus pacificus]|uniref:hypothetical protein n=1 Tax=Thermococcus pacificus TaxID=71998 RepID=UPI0012FD3FED|nr:hypothetical protein [Thermococcus pacificus]